MSAMEVRVPDIGGATDVEVIEVCVAAGDSVAVDQSLIVLESDKATMEIPSPQAGVVQQLALKVGDKVSEGDLILLLQSADDRAEVAEAGFAVPETVETAAAAAQSVAPRSESPAAPTRVRDIAVPDLGGASEVPVIEILVGPGDVVQAESPLLVLESDKATMEIPSPVAGRIQTLLVAVGTRVSEGTVIARIEASPEAVDDQRGQEVTETAVSQKPAPAVVVSSAVLPGASGEGVVPEAAAPGAKVHAGPAVRQLAREFGVDLGVVPSSGPRGRILKEDVQAFVKAGMQQLKAGVVSGAASGLGLPQVKLPDFSQFGAIERRPLSKIHRATADNMTRSWLTVPHVTQFDEADITDLESFRQSQKSLAERRGVKLSPLPFLVKACAYALETYPQFNVSLDLERGEIVQKRYVHIGVAVDTPQGLLVPVIRDAHRKGIWELASELAELAQKAKDRKLAPGDLQGGCFTISSLGSIGGTAFTPIVNTPEVAILGVSKAQMKPVWQETQFLPRLMLPLSLSYDHRAVNGADAARFTTLLSELLSDLRRLLM